MVACELLEKHRPKISSGMERVHNLAKLAGSLMKVSLDQEKYVQGEHPGRQDVVGRLEEFLCLLELVFKSVETFTSKSAVTRPYLKFLESFFETRDQTKKRAESAQRNTESQQKGDNAKKSKSDEDVSYPRHVYDALYKVLQKYADCCCGPPNPSTEPRKRHWGRLELRDTLCTDDNDVLFHTVKQRKGRGVRIEDTKDDSSIIVSYSGDTVKGSAKAGDAIEIKSTSEFCKVLGKDIGSVSMVVGIINEMFFDLNRAENIEVDIADETSIPLADVLQGRFLGPQSKLLLAYTLAKSVWQFYDSDFMSVRWTTESIQLLQEREGDEEDEDEEDDDERSVHWAPYFAFSFNKLMEGESAERLPPGQFIHRYPRVLALGELLYELGLKRPSKKQTKSITAPPHTTPVEPATLEKITNDTAVRIRRGVERRKWPDIGLTNTESLEKYRIIVANCVSESLFRQRPAEDSKKTLLELEDAMDIEERRAMLFSKVIFPLKELLRDTGWINESGNIPRQLIKGEAALPKKLPISQNPKPAELLADNAHRTPQVHTNGAQDAPKTSGIEAKAQAWLDHIKSSHVAQCIHTKLREDKALAENRICIAVLDTGYDPDAIFFGRERKMRLKGWKDYVEKDQSIQLDEDGHGTHVLSVLMKVAPAADIYVARIARNSPDLRNATENVAEAIEWARKDCKANIISMSFGFDEEIYVDGKPVISNAISKALHKTDQRILFFAAAANDGGNRAEMFPASSGQVLSIRGSDEFGWPQRFNPPPDYNAKTCFMTLGVDVPGASLSTSEDQGADVCQSGTSVATPIAAGIAAMLLGYARVYEEELHQMLGPHDEAKLSRLWRITGMSALFEKMAEEMANKWSYLNIHKITGDSHSMRLAMIARAVKEAKG
ncbi:hypothetical protein G7Z17_g4462 [Cylindrodendrum hubeiense]|uniref:Peptidase S8/S53 domain-containing protein n=1 Tax=Cylindrodendrum hubeiense TaxID=595255 RepID=A0A9P5L9X0_9HYPO|nr:hypothetical protein G7Z17_g4462 [Cylindrodendrum hubeiense]